ncbi:hypothetical protein [Microbacterium indicum]|uniref:hypothetical protein n=1 Tax=Microbacterium indicum TaxID=358100 RepID=UPI0012EBD5D6|nr:hypothetical protein [Microbacterium indicum]
MRVLERVVADVERDPGEPPRIVARLRCQAAEHVDLDASRAELDRKDREGALVAVLDAWVPLPHDGLVEADPLTR